MIQTGERTNLYENICRTFSIHSLHTFCSCNMIRPKENYGDRVLFIFFDVFLCFFVSTSGKTCDTFCCVAVFCLAWYNKENINKNELLPEPSPPGRLPTEQREWLQARCPGKPRLGQAGRPEAGTSAQHWKINKKIHAQASLVLKKKNHWGRNNIHHWSQFWKVCSPLS